MAQAKLQTRSLQRVYGRGLLLSILEKDSILIKIRVFNDGRFSAETVDWNVYWQSVNKLGHKKIEASLSALHSAWRCHIRSGFSITYRQQFCHRYFSLLDTLLSLRNELAGQAWLNALQSALGFECFGIVLATADDKTLAAGTCNLRNPCYLLSKLKMPDVLDDPQYLPVITVSDIEKPESFFYYRQYQLSHDSPISLLLYPAVLREKRAASFKLINCLACGLSNGIDPRTQERAGRLYQNVIHPILSSVVSSGTGVSSLEFVDIGAGSSSLTATLCHKIQETGFNLKFQLWFVDLEPADPARFFHNNNSKTFLDSLTYLGDDYRNWLSQPQPLPAINGLRIVLISKLFNNLSSFSVRYLFNEEFPLFLEGMEGYSYLEALHPSVCLAPGGSGAKTLTISNIRVPIQNGRTFAQVSLSSYYLGLYFLSGPAGSVESPEWGLFYLSGHLILNV